MLPIPAELPVTWTRIDTPETRRVAAHLDGWLDEEGYATIGTWQHSDGRVAIVYTDPACHGAFAVRLEDARRAEGDYTEWCNSTRDLADPELAALVRDEPTRGRGHHLRYAGGCTLVLTTRALTLSTPGWGQVMISRKHEAGDGGPQAFGASPEHLDPPTVDGLTSARMEGWDKIKRNATVYTVREAPALAAQIEATESAMLRGEPQPAVTPAARAEWETLKAEFPGLNPIE